MGLAFLLVLLTDRLTITLAFAAAGLAVLYPFTKRMTHMPQLVPGHGVLHGDSHGIQRRDRRRSDHRLAALRRQPAVDRRLRHRVRHGRRPWDLKVGIKSTAILFEEQDRLMIGVLQLAFIACLVMVGTRLELGAAWYLGVIGRGRLARLAAMADPIA